MSAYTKVAVALSLLCVMDAHAYQLGSPFDTALGRKYRTELESLIVPPEHLPTSCRLATEFETTPIFPATTNPFVTNDSQLIEFIAMAFGNKQLQEVNVVLTALYIDGSPRYEVGIWAVRFKTERAAVAAYERLKYIEFLQKDALLVRVLRDNDISKPCHDAIKDHLISDGFETLPAKPRLDPEHPLWRPILSNLIQVKAGIAVVEVATTENKAFEVTKEFFGDLRVGDKLSFSQCERIPRVGSTEDYLRSMLQAPIIDPPIRSDNTLDLPDISELGSVPPPETAISFIMLVWRLDGPRWGFTRQTHGDLFLIQKRKVFHLAYLTQGEHFELVWVPITPEQSYSEFVQFLEHEITKRKEGSRDTS